MRLTGDQLTTMNVTLMWSDSSMRLCSFGSSSREHQSTLQKLTLQNLEMFYSNTAFSFDSKARKHEVVNVNSWPNWLIPLQCNLERMYINKQPYIPLPNAAQNRSCRCWIRRWNFVLIEFLSRTIFNNCQKQKYILPYTTDEHSSPKRAE
jgi:hypothetical protein